MQVIRHILLGSDESETVISVSLLDMGDIGYCINIDDNTVILLDEVDAGQEGEAIEAYEKIIEDVGEESGIKPIEKKLLN